MYRPLGKHVTRLAIFSLLNQQLLPTRVTIIRRRQIQTVHLSLSKIMSLDPLWP